MISPVVLILDDVHLLHDSECRAALSVLADYVPAGSRLVLAGRTEPPVRVARLRAEGRLAEIGPGDLSLTVKEAASLLSAAEVVLCDDDVANLHQRTEGWPVARAPRAASSSVARPRSARSFAASGCRTA
jgi:LuxR family transcriptional regulator, maltose regulon positive regulatory protein